MRKEAKRIEKENKKKEEEEKREWQRKKFEKGKERFLQEVNRFLADEKLVHKVSEELLLKNSYVLWVIEDYTDYNCQYITDLSYKIPKEKNSLLEGCIISTMCYVRDYIESLDFYGVKLVISYPKEKKMCSVM